MKTSSKQSDDARSLLSFKAISAFIIDLTAFKTKQRSLALYIRLIERTNFTHEAAITKHVNAFRELCKSNERAISEKNPNYLEKTTINYSEKVFINIAHLLKIADDTEKEAIWSHLTVISAFVYPEGKAKELLKKTASTAESASSSSSSSGDNGNFLTDMISAIEGNIDRDAKPAEAVSKLMQSGALNDVISTMSSKMEDGKLDLGSMMNSVQNLVGSLSENQEVPSEIKNMTDNLTKMVSNLK